MTITAESRPVEYDADGQTRTFPVPFRFLEDSHLLVAIVDKETDAITYQGYVVSGAGAATGGTVTFNAAPASGKRVLIYNDPPPTQTARYQEGAKFPAASHEKALDWRTVFEHRTRQIAKMGVRAPITERYRDMSLPPLSARRGKLLGFHPVEGTPVSFDTGISAPPDQTVEFVSTVAAAASTVDAGTLYIRTGGFATAADGGGAIYKKVDAEPSHSMKFKTANNIWFEYADATVNVLAAGADRTGATSSSAAFAAAYTKGKTVFAPEGTYSLSEPIAVPSQSALIGAGVNKTIFQRYPGASITHLIGCVEPPNLTTPTKDIELRSFTVQGDNTLDHGVRLAGCQFSDFQDITVKDCTKPGAWGFSLLSKGHPDLSLTNIVYCNKNNWWNVNTENCFNGRQIQKGPDDPAGPANTAGNINYFFGGGDARYQGTGLGLYSTQGSIVFGTINQTNYDETIGIDCAGQATLLLNVDVDAGLSLNHKGIPGYGTIPGTKNEWGFLHGRKNEAIAVKFSRYNDARGGAATGSILIGQVGNGCYDRITFTDSITFGTCHVMMSLLDSLLAKVRIQNYMHLMDSPVDYTRIVPSVGGIVFSVDHEAQADTSAFVDWGYGRQEGETSAGEPKYVTQRKIRMAFNVETGVAGVHVNRNSAVIDEVGTSITGDGLIAGTRDGNYVIDANRLTSDGTIARFARDGTVVGTISVTGSATAYNESSDWRLKTDVVDISKRIDAGKIIDAMRPAAWVWKTTGETGYGFIAHELQAVAPWAVTGKKDEVDENNDPVYQGVDKSKLVPLLVEAVKDLRARVAELEAACG